MADKIDGYRDGYDRKMMVADWITKIGFPLTLNAVLHRSNLHQLLDMLKMAQNMGTRRIEMATLQFHGWASKNRDALMRTKNRPKRPLAL